MRIAKMALMRKFNDFKKQTCSAPFTLTVFLISSMLIIFSLESLGLLRKEKNLDYRIPTPEVTIKLLDIENKLEKNLQENSEFAGSIDSNDHFALNMENRESIDMKKTSIDMIQHIMIQAAFDQLYFERELCSEEFRNATNCEENSFEESEEIEDVAFWDI
mmetsp:Transcript_2298/g.2361  ORF Transcript_2298/g.2361 Transcript_2298/m.2361 type:complete len:161 (-) Transcript_2298:61-543(-)